MVTYLLKIIESSLGIDKDVVAAGMETDTTTDSATSTVTSSRPIRTYAVLFHVFNISGTQFNVLDKPDSLEFWIKNVGEGDNGGKTVEFRVVSTIVHGKVYVLHYIWRLDSSPVPSNTETHKYIDMGTSIPVGQWVNVERNLYEDWVNSGLPTSAGISTVVLFNQGTIQGQQYKGQQINMDSAYIDIA